ncbi:bacteriophage abortive infection AbiH family protein [Cellvibrio fontiphilus]|uniref:Bacteriophage abortive infection AbiH family protein n=1 Tax=Cellvibrio fontiphilus TaxID=1815559 RepID=A0ABV7FI90_9GAMM
MKILYVIGNGFDLWHNLPTSYGHFYESASEFLDEISTYYQSANNESALWSNFEEDLGRFDCDSFYDAYNDIDISDDNFKPSMAYGLEDELTQEANNIIDGIQDTFLEWIESIDSQGCERKCVFENDGKILSFNYTATIQNVYQIDNEKIFHIHGRAGNDQLIIGHGDFIHFEPELDEEGNSNRHMFSDAEGAAKSPLHHFKKPVEEIIDANKSYFDSLRNIEMVVILGHSLNSIDIPYFGKINKMASAAHWVVSYHTDSDLENHKIKLSEIGIDESKITMLKIDLVCSEVRSRMNFSCALNP